MTLDMLVRPELIFPDLPGPDRATALRALAERTASAAEQIEADELYQRLREREELGSTCVGSGVAIPHCKLGSLDRSLVAIGICPRGIDYDGDNGHGERVRVLFLVLSPVKSPAEHLQSLAAVSQWVKTHRLEKLRELDDPGAIHDLIRQADE